jgi:hypothetical protein
MATTDCCQLFSTARKSIAKESWFRMAMAMRDIGSSSSERSLIVERGLISGNEVGGVLLYDAMEVIPFPVESATKHHLVG